MRTTRILATLFTALVLAQPAFAEEKIAVVNIQQIMRDSGAAKSVREQLQNKQKSFQSELDAKEKALQKEDQELVKQQANLSKEAFEQKVNSFRQKAMSARQEIQNKKAQLDKGFQGALNQIQTTTLDIVKEVASEKGYNIVLSSSQVLYNGPNMDITGEVLARLNKKLPNVSVKF